MDHKETGYQNFVQWRVLMNTVINLPFPYEPGVFLDQLIDYQVLKNRSAMSWWARADPRG